MNKFLIAFVAVCALNGACAYPPAPAYKEHADHHGSVAYVQVPATKISYVNEKPTIVVVPATKPYGPAHHAKTYEAPQVYAPAPAKTYKAAPAYGPAPAHKSYPVEVAPDSEVYALINAAFSLPTHYDIPAEYKAVDYKSAPQAYKTDSAYVPAASAAAAYVDNAPKAYVKPVY